MVDRAVRQACGVLREPGLKREDSRAFSSPALAGLHQLKNVRHMTNKRARNFTGRLVSLGVVIAVGKAEPTLAVAPKTIELFFKSGNEP